MIKKRPTPPPATLPDGSVSIEVINRFGDPQSELAKERYELGFASTLLDEGDYYRPPISFSGLVRLLRVNPHHGGLPSFRARQAVKYMLDNPYISRQTLTRAIMDDQTSGNAFFLVVRNKAGGLVRIEYRPMIRMRRAKADNTYGWLTNEQEFNLFQPGEILHVMQHDPAQQIYGIPHWIGALQSILLGEDVRIFPRLFFKNGGSTGDVLATSGLSSNDQKAVEEKFAQIKGSGRWMRVVLQFARGKIDEIIKTIPYSTGSDKIDYSKLANMTATDIMEAWQIDPSLAGMRPEVAGGAGDLDKIKLTDYENQTLPLQQRFADALNTVLPVGNPLVFREYDYFD